MDALEAPKKRSFPIIRTLILFILLVAAFSTYAHFFAAQKAGGQQVVDNIEVLDARLENLEHSIVQHEERLKALEDTTQKLASSPAPAAPAANASTPAPAPANDDRIAALEKEIATLKVATPLDGTRIYQSIRLLSTFHHLSDKVIGGKPFATELAAFEDVANIDESAGSPLSTLSPYGDSGIPTFATLLVTFDQSVESLNAAEAIPPSTASFWERFKYNLMHLITIRRVGEVQAGNGADAVVARAQAHLEKEEVEAAVTEIKSLPEGPRGNFAAWLDDAQIVTEAPSLIDQVEEQVLQKAFRTEPAATPVPAPAAAPAPAPAPAPEDSSGPKP